MDFSFDIRGYLKPYGKNEINKEDLQTGFVDPFDEASSRGRLYQGYLKYNEDLQTLLRGQRYLQWIDGSFISTQINPGDIDLVSLIDYQLIEKYESELKRFLNRQGKENYGIDGYIVRVYPQGHNKYVQTKSDLIYWESWFSKSKKNRKKQRFPKGFVEIKF